MAELAIVIPTLARPERLRRALERLDRQDLEPGRFEVIVVVDAAEADATAAEALAAGRRHRFRVLRATAPGASAARNLGWRSAESPLILFCDDDILTSPRLVRAHLERHRLHPGPELGVLGRVRWADELRVTPFMRWLERGIQFDYPHISGDNAGWGRFYTANASVKRELIERADGFDEVRLPFGYEDLDLAYRMSKLGFELIYAREAEAEHLHPMDVELWKRRVRRIAVAEREFCRLHPELPPFFHRMFSQAEASEPARGRGRRLAGLIPPDAPWIGPKVWLSADLAWKQELAPHFLAAWEAAATAPGAAQPDLSERDSASSAGSDPGGPK